jgi:hypothetical protein
MLKSKVLVLLPKTFWGDKHRRELDRYHHAALGAPDDGFYDTYFSPLMRLDSASILAADERLIEYLHPYVRFLAGTFTTKMAFLRTQVNRYPMEYVDFSNEWRRLRPFFDEFSTLQQCLA